MDKTCEIYSNASVMRNHTTRYTMSCITGFYRVNYDRNGWQRIFKVLHSDKFGNIHVLNRAALVDDLLNLGRAGYQDYETVLDGITYLKRETSYLAFTAALNGLSYLDKRFSGYKEHSLFKVS